MRGAKVEMGAMFSYLSPEERVPADHPLRAIRVIVDRSLAELDGHFNQMYSDLGRPSIPPEPLLPEIPGIGRATALISVDRSEAMTPMLR